MVTDSLAFLMQAVCCQFDSSRNRFLCETKLKKLSTWFSLRAEKNIACVCFCADLEFVEVVQCVKTLIKAS